MARLAALPDRQARFTDEKHLSALAAPLTSQGNLIFRHPDHLEKITSAPRQERMVIEGGVLTIAGPTGAPRAIELDAHPALQGLATTITATLAGNLPALQRMFAIQASGTPSSWRLVLTPSAPALARFIATVTLDGTGADLRHLRITQANGDTETLAIQPEG